MADEAMQPGAVSWTDLTVDDAGPRPLSGGTVAVIRDPAGAVCALFEPPATSMKGVKPAKQKRKSR